MYLKKRYDVMAKALISVQNVSKAAGNRQLLSAVSFTVAPQSLVSLIGPNGAGKSTLIKIILGLDHDYTGTISISPGQRLQYIAQQTPGDPYQLPLSVYEYLSIGSTYLFSGQRETPDFGAALEHVGVAATTLTQSYHSLSGGERQRVAIARALLARPTILVLDEPLAAVDYASRSGLYELIRHLQKDHAMTVLLVSHDIESVLPISDQVLCLNQTLHTDCHPRDLQNAGAINHEHRHNAPQPHPLMTHHC
jgi:zinc transport system ATP-binding protein